MNLSLKIENLLNKGVKIPDPYGITVGDDVSLDRISADNVVIYPGARIYGGKTFICDGATIGDEGPVTIENCQVGFQATLKGGVFKNAVFLTKASMGSGSHVREGTILEEEASAAHTVGLKQTILFPFVTLGSLINFCDCLMAGGTSKRDHSEVGSSYIHFNYTPNQDKATPSLIGDVPYGVMLNQRPIFLGGQGGLVGPCRLTYGTVIAAGSICKKNELRPGRLIVAVHPKNMSLPYNPYNYLSIRKVFINNLYYIANLLSLQQWYQFVRSAFIGENFPAPLLEGLTEKISMGLSERIRQLDTYIENLPTSVKGNFETSRIFLMTTELTKQWPDLKSYLLEQEKAVFRTDLRDPFLEIIAKAIKKTGKDYLQAIKSLSPEDSTSGSDWLASIVSKIVEESLTFVPSFQ
jgi:UDP-N-acetylglucosamine/UDP-N-acetylgalactosamine diphosphorylase